MITYHYSECGFGRVISIQTEKINGLQQLKNSVTSIHMSSRTLKMLFFWRDSRERNPLRSRELLNKIFMLSEQRKETGQGKMKRRRRFKINAEDFWIRWDLLQFGTFLMIQSSRFHMCWDLMLDLKYATSINELKNLWKTFSNLASTWPSMNKSDGKLLENLPLKSSKMNLKESMKLLKNDLFSLKF